MGIAIPAYSVSFVRRDLLTRVISSYILYICTMRAYVYACHRVHVEVRGQLEEVSFLLPPSGFQDQTQVVRLGDKRFNPLSYFAGPITPVVFCF